LGAGGWGGLGTAKKSAAHEPTKNPNKGGEVKQR